MAVDFKPKSNRGGARPGAGRKPKGAEHERKPSYKTTHRTEVALRALASGINPLEVMLQTMRDAWDGGDKDKACAIAKDAAPYVHPKLAAVEHKGNTEHPLVMSILSSVPRDDDQPAAVNGSAAHH